MADDCRRRCTGVFRVAALQVTRPASLTQEIAAAMSVAFNGETVRDVASRVDSGDLAIVRSDSPDGTAYAIVSQSGDLATVEAVEGPGGTLLTALIVQAARRAGLRCEAWVLSESRARLAARAGLMPTGARRISGSGREQLQVMTQ